MINLGRAKLRLHNLETDFQYKNAQANLNASNSRISSQNIEYKTF